MRRLFTLCVAVAGSSCVNLGVAPVQAPPPLSFHASRQAREATQVAVIALMTAGFRVEQTDSLGQQIRASRTATHNGNEDYIACDIPRGSAAAANRETTLTINFRAAPSTAGSDVAIDSRVVTSYPGYAGTVMQSAANETDCVSKGLMERQLQSALR
jgi:hypothetical protein